jgi:hypothetical protein
LLVIFLSGLKEQGDSVNSHKATTPAGGGPALRRCVSCGKVIDELSGAETLVRESSATLAMSSAARECSACRLSEYRRSLKDQYRRW